MKGYTSFKLTDHSRQWLLNHIAPVYPDVIAHHITYEFGVDSEKPLPNIPESVSVIDIVNDGDGVQALVVEVNGSTRRPDGGTYHITWSIDRSKGRKPVHSNQVITKHGFSRKFNLPISTIPVFTRTER